MLSHEAFQLPIIQARGGQPQPGATSTYSLGSYWLDNDDDDSASNDIVDGQKRRNEEIPDKERQEPRSARWTTVKKRAERRRTTKAYIAPQTPPAFQRVEEKRSAEKRVSEVRRTRPDDGRRVFSKGLPSS